MKDHEDESGKPASSYSWSDAANRSANARVVSETIESKDPSQEEETISLTSDSISLTEPSSISLTGWAEIGIDRTKSRSPWQAGLFAYAQHLRSWTNAHDATDPGDPGVIEDAVRAWHREKTKRLPGLPWDDVWNELVGAWPKIRLAFGERPFDHTVASVADPATWPTEVECGYDRPQTRHLLALCWALAGGRGQIFHLSNNQAEELCGFKATNAARRSLLKFCADGWMEIAQKHTDKRSTRYRFVRCLLRISRSGADR